MQQITEVSDRLRFVLAQYVEALKQNPETPDGEYEKQREDYRRELVEGVIERYDEDGFIEELDDNENDVFDPQGELIERINHTVDAKFPLKQTNSRVPAELKTNLEKLISLLGL